MLLSFIVVKSAQHFKKCDTRDRLLQTNDKQCRTPVSSLRSGKKKNNWLHLPINKLAQIEILY